MTRKKVKKAFKFRFYPTQEQAEVLERTYGCVRLVYNKALEERTRSWYEDHVSLDYVDTAKLLTQWRRSQEFSFLSEVSVVPLQQSLRHLQKAFSSFWKKTAKYPKFKSKKNSTLGLEYSRSGFSIKNGDVFVAKIKSPLNINYSQPIQLENVSTITVKKDQADRWFISMLSEIEIEEKRISGETTGIDAGAKDALVLDDGRKLNPSDLFDVEKKDAKIKKYQKRLSRKEKGSRNRAKARLKLARAYAEKRDAQQDWLHKVTTWLVEEFDVICLEDLNIRGMTRKTKGKGKSAKSGLNRSILEHNLSEFRRMVEYKTQWYGKECVAIDRFYPSSKRCSECGKINQELNLRDRHWVCQCGAKHDRDVNAATNIKAAGLAVIACGDSVRLNS